MNLPDLLKTTLDLGGSDLHLSIGTPPQVRVDGDLQRLTDMPVLTPDVLKSIAYSVLTDAQKKKFEESLELDMAFGLRGVGRFRCNLFNQKGAVGAVYRLIPQEIKALEQLGLPPVLAELADRPRGLVLVTGPTGSGKSTTLAAMIDRINQSKPVHILTIEDPIEYLHQHKTALVNQRELHADTNSFTAALRAALREDPDVVLVGEMRDLETMEAAMKLAETGHLTMATLHTNSAAQTITRIIDAFPAHQQAQIRTQLSLVLEGIVCQALLPKAGGKGRVAALEILVANPAIRNLIRDDKIHQIYGTMQAGQEKYGMQTMNQSLARLFERRVITREEALKRSSNRDELIMMLERGAPLPPAMAGAAGVRRPPMQGVGR
ncbi:MAG: type IV pili twitching motility protein PilT [Acidobacteria bacterium SCN 69-37]|nr:MAG: type IV pili twitching motility protein PilT [Acidobacteria bacterium SCN 69-37]